MSFGVLDFLVGFLSSFLTLSRLDTYDATQSLIRCILVPSSLENNSEQTMQTDKSGKWDYTAAHQSTKKKVTSKYTSHLHFGISWTQLVESRH